MTFNTPSPFSTNIPNFQTAWDSTSLGWFKTCPRKYQYQMIESWSPRSKGIHLAFGGWYASGVERYAHHRASGLAHDDAVLKVIAWALEETGVYIPVEGEPLLEWTPWDSGDPYKNRYTLLRSLVWNMDDREHSPWHTVILANGKPAVELSFNFPAFTIEGETITLSGHMDELVENNGQIWVKDDKTTKAELNAQYFAQYTPHNQMSLYTIAGKIVTALPIAGVLIRAAQIQVNNTRFATQQAPRTPSVLAEWMHDTELLIRRAREYAIAGYWPMNDVSCNDYGGCIFRKVCSVSPSHRKSWLETDFVKRVWNPLLARGDV